MVKVRSRENANIQKIEDRKKKLYEEMCEQARFRCNDYWLNYRVKMQFTSVIQVSHLLSNSVAVLFEYRPKAERIT